MLYYIEAIRRYFDFKGRSSRSEYWYFALIHFIILGILTILPELDNASTILYLVYYVVLLIPSFAVAVRRMHDVGKSGWYLLIPIYNLILAFTAGDKGPNQFGEDPKR